MELPREVRTSLAEIQDKLRPEIPRARWTRPEGIHLTIKFLGEIDQEKVAAIKKILDGIAQGRRSFELSLLGVGAFPRLAAPRVLWVGIEPSEALHRLHRDVEKALIKHGFKPEKRRFSGHLTLARLRGGRWPEERRRTFLSCHAVTDGRTIPAHRIVLFRSELAPGGAVYKPLHISNFEKTDERTIE